MKYQWVAGKWLKPKRDKIPVINPATEEIIDYIPRGLASDGDLAVRAARSALETWRWVPAIEKAALLRGIARDLRACHEHLATLMTKEGGKPLCENWDEVEWVAGCFDYYAEIGRNSRGVSIPPTAHHQLNFTIKEPCGVVFCIIPWNYPLLLMSWKVAPALMAGNTVIIMPSSETPLSTLALTEIFAKLPPGVVNIVTGNGPEIGEAIINHPGVDLVAFTGSTETGRRVGKLCAEQVKKFHAELGGNDPFIVCSDADLEIASRAVCWAAFLNSGQVCTSCKRLYVFDDIAEEFTRRVVKFTRSLIIGNGLGKDTDLGPMINLKHLDDVHSRVQEAVNDGAKVLCGGRRPPGFSKGFFYEPTVLTNVKQKMRIVATETFGPVLPIMRVRDIDHAIELANDSAYGLGANIYTNNMEWAMKAAERITAGTFWINDPLTDNDAAPFGGMRESGHSRELGEEGLDAFRETKHVHLDYKQEIKPYWYPYSKYNERQ
jgi:betaine-aldehyde dehydrogenase